MSIEPSSSDGVVRRILMDNPFGPEFSAALDDNFSVVARLTLRLRKPQNANRPSASSSGESQLEPFKIMLNVTHFQRDEIEVKIVNNYVVVHGKHEEKIDEHGIVSRDFTRRFLLPEDVKPDTVKSELKSNGILTITAPRNVIPLPGRNERIVPIIMEKPVRKDKKSAKSALKGRKSVKA